MGEVKTYIIREKVIGNIRCNLYVQVDAETQQQAFKQYAKITGSDWWCFEVWELIKGVACVPTPD